MRLAPFRIGARGYCERCRRGPTRSIREKLPREFHNKIPVGVCFACLYGRGPA